MKKIHPTRLLILSVSLLWLSGCITSPPDSPMVNNDKLEKEEYLSPENSALVFGYLSNNNLIGNDIPVAEFAQINPEQSAMFIAPGLDDNFFYFQPVPAGSCLNMVYCSWSSGRTTYIFKPGLQKKPNVTVTVEKPGLIYAGSYIYTTMEKEKIISFDVSFDSYGFFPVGKGTELEALEELLDKMKKTDWEPVIAERIKELSNE